MALGQLLEKVLNSTAEHFVECVEIYFIILFEPSMVYFTVM